MCNRREHGGVIMGKRERKIEYIKNRINNVCSSTYPKYVCGNIPKNLLQAACSEYAGAIQYQDALALVDTSILGNGKKGLVITEKKVYYNGGMLGKRGCITFKQITENGTIPGAIFSAGEYNQQALVELLAGLAQIESENLQTKIDGANKTMQDLNDTINAVGELVNQGKELFGAFAGLFGSDNKNNEK